MTTPVGTATTPQMPGASAAQGPAQGQPVASCKSKDETPAPTPVLRRAICFDLAKEGAEFQPNPPQRPAFSSRPRDPVLIELDNIELGAHFEFVSLSDNPAASFECADDVRELDPVGYDIGQRRATIALNPDEMKEKGFEPGERIVLRQVDKNGNVSNGIFIHLTPDGWASGRVVQDDGAGKKVTMLGGHIDIPTGIRGLPGAPDTGKVERVLGTVVRDTSAPKLLPSNVKLQTFEWSKADREVATALAQHRPHLIKALGRDHFKLDEAQKLAENAALPEPLRNALKSLVANGGEMFRRFDNAAYGDKRDGIVGQPDYHEVRDNERSVFVVLDRAVEPGVSVVVQNSRSGGSANLTLSENQRQAYLKLTDAKDGDPLVLTFRDAAGNWGKPYAMEYSSKCKDGKAGADPFSVRMASLKLS